jgi:hypothetical protein
MLKCDHWQQGILFCDAHGDNADTVWHLTPKRGFAKPPAMVESYYGFIVIWLSTFVVPGADHAARSASSFSAHERTLP